MDFKPERHQMIFKSSLVFLVVVFIIIVLPYSTLAAQPFIYGDINDDDLIDVRDVVLLLRHILNLEDFTEEQFKAADVNQDGVIDINDAILVMKYALGLITSFPVEVRIESVEEAEISVAFGTEFGNINFPGTVKVTLYNQAVTDINVEWSEESSQPAYNPQSPGKYNFTGELINLPEGVSNPYGLTAAVAVTVRQQEISTPTAPDDVKTYATVEELEGEFQVLLPGVLNVIVTYENAASILGATKIDRLELLDKDKIVSEMEYFSSPQEVFLAPAVQSFTEDEAGKLLVRIKR